MLSGGYFHRGVEVPTLILLPSPLKEGTVWLLPPTAMSSDLQRPGAHKWHPDAQRRPHSMLLGQQVVFSQVEEMQDGTNSPYPLPYSFWLLLITPSPPHVRSHWELRTGIEVDSGKETNTPPSPAAICCERDISKDLWDLINLAMKVSYSHLTGEAPDMSLSPCPRPPYLLLNYSEMPLAYKKKMLFSRTPPLKTL